MNCCGIVAEYNPFHNGHKHHIERAREETSCDYVIAVMSGSFVQRGEAAVADKFSRARMALRGGADMVIELPAAFSLASAERFARGAVGILCGTGLVVSLAFGSESGDIDRIREAARLIDMEPPELSAAIKAGLSSGLSFPDARARAFCSLTGSDALSSPNDILATEYIRALGVFRSPIAPVAIKRSGPGHDSVEIAEEAASAAAIRELLFNGETGRALSFMPEGAGETLSGLLEAKLAPRQTDALSSAILYRLRTASPDELLAVGDVGEGLENLILREAKSATSYAALLDGVKSRRYTLARLRRICLCTLLGITADIFESLPEALYIRVLGIKKEAKPLLSALSASAKLPVITKFSDTCSLPDEAKHVHDIELLASDIVCMTSPLPAPARFDYSSPLIIE